MTKLFRFYYKLRSLKAQAGIRKTNTINLLIHETGEIKQELQYFYNNC